MSGTVLNPRDLLRVSNNVLHCRRRLARRIHVLCQRNRLDHALSSCSKWFELAGTPSRASSTSKSAARIDPKREWVLQPELDPHIRASEGTFNLDDELLIRDTGFSVCLLGTGAGSPSLINGNAATALRMGGTTYLFDAGEGVQLQLMKSKLRMSDIRKIFITHLHADHIFGLPGLLLSLQLLAKKDWSPQKDTPLLEIYGPEGLYNYIAVSLSLSHSELKWLRVEVYELQGSSASGGSGGAATRFFKEFRHKGLIRKSIPRNVNGTWTLETAQEVTSPNELLHFRSHNSSTGVYVTAAEVYHLPKLACFGFVVQEPHVQPRTIDADRACAAGVRPGPKYNILKFGFPVTSDEDETKLVVPEDVLVGVPAVSRSVAVLGDCCAVPDPLANLCRDVDVLVHEATHSEKDVGKYFRGHSTGAMAGSFADRVNPKVLLLNHISVALRTTAAERALAEEAEKQISGRTRVQIGYDRLELMVPREGFPW